MVLSIPLTPETRHLIGAAELALMKPTAFLVNVARGPVVDEAALVEALRAKRIAGAGLDVFEEEPKIHPGLLELENLALTPHIGSASGATRRRMATRAVENCVAALEGQRPAEPGQPRRLALGVNARQALALPPAPAARRRRIPLLAAAPAPGAA